MAKDSAARVKWF